jgi:glycosyltransferase involved in cell wall biosynthesis
MTASLQPAVTVIVPCRNEERYIGACLDSILGNDYPQDRLEILVIDALSEDETRAIVSRYAMRHACIRLLDNPKLTTPCAFNAGIAAASGEIIVVMGAHAKYSSSYLSRVVDWLCKSGADNVGGVCVTVPADDSPMARAIARGLSHPFGVGLSHFRVGTSKPRWVDTVFGGCYRKEVFDRIGVFDEQLIRNQDDEFNQRLIARGGKILLVPDVVSYYYPRRSLAQLWKMYYQYGYFKPLVALKVGRIGTVRQIVPICCLALLVVLTMTAIVSEISRLLLLTLVAAYLLADFAVSFAIGLSGGLRCAGWMLLVFPALHVGYGIGYLRGIVDFWIRKKHDSTVVNAVPLSR